MKKDAKWFEDVLNSIRDMVLVKGDKSRLLWANKAFLDYYGMTQSELENIVDGPQSDPDDTIQYVKDDHYVYTSGKPLNIESEPVTNSKGVVSYFHTVKTPVFDENNQVIQTVGVSRLIEDGKLLEASEEDRSERKDNISRLKSLAKDIPTAVAMFDMRNRFISYSNKWVKLFNEKKEILGEFYDETFEQKLPMIKHFDKVRSTNTDLAFENQKIFFDKQVKYLNSKIVPWKFPTGETGGVILLIEDITERTVSEMKLKEAQAQLVQSAKLAALGELSSGLAHELNNPLFFVKGYNERIRVILGRQNNISKEDLEELVTGIESGAERMAKIIEHFRDFSRQSSNESAPCSVNDIISRALDLFLEQLKLNNIEVEKDLSSENPMISCDRNRLEQVFVNLIANAKDALESLQTDSEKKIRVHTSANKNNALVKISDTGIGIPAEKISKIFDPFFTTKEAGKGTGLGLSISYNIIKDFMGDISVSSDSGEGTTFSISIPLLKDKKRAA